MFNVSGLFLLIISVILFFMGYLFYGRYLARKFKLDNTQKTPAHTMKDGVDYVPTRSVVLLGHHFASIAGAAPIIGPITAAVFGWGPVYLWIVVGGIFMGAVHDFSALVASVRHKAQSIGKVIEEHVGPFGKKLFLVFAWATLVLVLAAFLVIVARTFEAKPEVGTASALFILLALLFGVSIYRLKVNLVAGTLVGIVLLFLCIYLGMVFPLQLPMAAWILILMGYIFVASVVPVWVLLQPRDYLNSFLLYLLLFGAFLGIVVTNPVVRLEIYRGFSQDIGYLFPILFVTVACGAISGFHSLVASGTTSKQLDKETDTQPIGYGGMLIESLLAVIALITVAVLTQQQYHGYMSAGGGGPVALFANGVGNFMSKLGLPLETGISFAALTVSAFALTTLDTATRLSRFSFQEFFGHKKVGGQRKWLTNRFVGTFVSVAAGGGLALTGQWKAIWPLFGSANQLLAALALLAVTLWLKNKKTANWFTRWPMYFMYVMTNCALLLLLWNNLRSQNYLLAFFALLLLGVAVSMVVHALKALRR
ncbi:MAG: carbon starvation protein A [Candidatus Aminicenantes bacterium]|nr:MAG: carbon starvation protein A [Candidatus Aminicenantes bacterium]